MTTYAALTDGTTTITFASPGSLGWYRIETGWTPKVAGLRQSQLGGRGPYEDVTEEIPVSVGGSNAAHMYANMQALNVLLQQSNAWYRNAPVSAVLFKYSPEGAMVSTAASPLQAAIWNADFTNGAALLGIPQSGSAVWSSGATMRFSRGGLWLHTSASASAAASNGEVVTIPLAAASNLSPTAVTMTNSNATVNASTRIPSWVVGNSASSITLINVERLSGTGWSAVADSANFALNGSVARFSAAIENGLSGSFAGVPASARSFTVLANVKQTFGPQAALKITLSIDQYFAAFAATALTQIPTAASNGSQWINFGTVNTSFTPAWLLIFPTISGSSQFDIDTVALVDNDTAQVVAAVRSPTLSYYAQDTITIDHRALSSPYPSFTSSTGYPYKYYGDPYISTSAGSVYCMLMSNLGGSITSGKWRSGDLGSAASMVVNTWTLTRTAGYTSAV